MDKKLIFSVLSATSAVKLFLEAISKTISVVMSGLAPKAHACAICLAHPCLRQAGMRLWRKPP
ncbi:MAG: hypothetical protein HY088_07800 [Ignavibacteriales bacterium]|nr:hypothetical protein [Ignavibacteriales bacterium]